MKDNPRADGSRGRDPYAALRLIALIAAVAGVIVLAAAAFVLSYGGIHKIALSAGVSPSVARIFPVIFDAMLVVSCAAVVSLRSAGWWQRTYSWLSTLVLLAVVAAADAAHATGTHLPRKPAAATVAVLPWVLLLLAFSLLLSMLRQFRRTRAVLADAAASDTAGPDAVVSNVAVSGTRPGLDILERRGPAPQPTPAGTAIPPSAAHPSATRPSAIQPSATQPSAGHPARTVVDSAPARESAPPLTLPADAVPAARTSAPQAPASPDPAPAAGPVPQDNAVGRTDTEKQPQRSPFQPPPPPGPQQAEPPEPAAGPGEAAAGPATAESALNGSAPARAADREPPGQARVGQEPAGEDQAVQEQVALEQADEEGPGDRQPAPAPEPEPPAANAQSADAQPSGPGEAQAGTPETERADSGWPGTGASGTASSGIGTSGTGASDTGQSGTGQSGTGQSGTRQSDAEHADVAPSDTAPSDIGSSDTGASGTEPPSTEPPDAEPSGTGASDTGASDTGEPGSGEPPRTGAPPAGEVGPESAADQPSGAGGGTIHVPHQPMRAPVPAPSPHFDRLRSTPTPPEDEPDSES